MNNLIELVKKLLKQTAIRYFMMAGFVVCIELAVFAVLNIPLHITYLIATPASMIVGIFLNWWLSRILVFSGSKHKMHVEFTLIMTTSAVGIGIQLGVTAICVEIFHLFPLIGKFFAIIITFFWNYWVRKRYIFEFDTF